MNPANCLKCESSLGTGFHMCQSRVSVVHPEVLREHRATANPLDRLTLGDMLAIYGEDPDEILEEAERRLEESHVRYLKGQLIFRVELQCVSGLGFQGGADCWAIEVADCTDDDLSAALDFINSEPYAAVSLDRDETYLCRLVSLDRDGTRCVWRVRRLCFDGHWKVNGWL